MKSRNWIPAAIAFLPAILLPLVQMVIRPHFHEKGILMVVLGSAPNFIIGMCFPYAGIMRPSLFTVRTGNVLFAISSLATLFILVGFEYWYPFQGGQTFDPNDIVASIVGVAAAVGGYHFNVKPRLKFGRWVE